MTKRTIMCCSVILLLGILAVANVRSQENPVPRFGSTVIQMGGRVMSPQGDFVALAERNEEDQEVTIQLWDVREYSLDGPSFLAEPARNTTLEYRRGPAPVSLIVLAFSPDERFLAIRKDHDLTLLTVPDLGIFDVLPMTSEFSVLPDELNWSADSKLIAFRNDETAFVVWNIETDEMHQYPIRDYGRILAVEDGWIIIPTFLKNSETAFWSCTRLLEQCTQHAFDGITPTTGMPFSVFAAPRGQLVLMSWGQSRSDITVWVWRRQENGSYRLDEMSMSGEKLGNLVTRPVIVSADGQYLVTVKNFKPQVWDTETLAPVQTIETSCGYPFLSFLPDSRHLVLFCGDFTLTLYEIGKTAPVDALDLDRQLAIDSAAIDGLYSQVDVNPSGEWVIVNLGGAGPARLLVPLKYGQD